MITARGIVEGLGGKWRGKRAMCRCPAHDDRSPSMSVSMTRDGRPLVHCFSGCTQAELIAALTAMGLWEGGAKVDPGYPGYLTRPHDGHTNKDDRERQQFAKSLWDNASPTPGTLVETYLMSRGINPRPSPALKYIPRLKHAPSGKQFPCMIAALHDFRNEVVAVQRTWLSPDGSGKAPVEMAKMTLGPMGHASVKLSRPFKTLGIAEGIETALSCEALYQIPTWATLSASRLKAIRVPPQIEMVVIFGDTGLVGKTEAFEAAEYYEKCGFKVDVYFPEKSFSDFNDVLKVRRA